MHIDEVMLTAIVIFLGINTVIALCFWLHELLENRIHCKLKAAVERAVRAVEQLCASLENPEKKRQAVLRVEALLGWYRWFIPSLVIDTAIEAEIYVIKQLHRKLSVDHDTPAEIACGEGGD